MTYLIYYLKTIHGNKKNKWNYRNTPTWAWLKKNELHLCKEEEEQEEEEDKEEKKGMEKKKRKKNK